MVNYFDQQSRNASIVSRKTKNNKSRTETKNREDGVDMAVTTDAKTNATALFIDFEGGNANGGDTIQLSGRQARTLYRLLTNHYGYVGKSFDPIKVTVGS